MKQVSVVILLRVISTQQHWWQVLQAVPTGLSAHPAKGQYLILGAGKQKATFEGNVEQMPPRDYICKTGRIFCPNILIGALAITPPEKVPLSYLLIIIFERATK